MSNAPTESARLFRYWVTPDWDEIRIAWFDLQGVERSATAYRREGCRSLGWHYGRPSDALQIATRDCLDAGLDFSVPGCEFIGEESYAEQDRQVSDRCQGCGVVQASLDDLSEQGHCGRCYVASMATPDALRHAGAI